MHEIRPDPAILFPQCVECAAPFSGSLSYREEGGQPYCDPCYTATVLPRCAGCTQPITDRALRAMDQQWHVTCFTCQVRHHLLHLPGETAPALSGRCT